MQHKYKDHAKMEFGMSFIRQGDFPIDSTSIFESKKDAVDYVKNDPTAYVGQIISVIDHDNLLVELYVIGYTRTLISVKEIVGQGSSSGGNPDNQSLELNNGKLELFAFHTINKEGMTLRSKADGNGGYILEWFDINKSFSDILLEIEDIKLELAKKVDKKDYMTEDEASLIINKYKTKVIK